MTHTPGPWRYVRQNPSPTTGEHMIAGATPGYLAEVRDCGSGDVAANANLIAQAPEMLETLQNIIACCNANDGDSLANAVNDAVALVAYLTGPTQSKPTYPDSRDLIADTLIAADATSQTKH